jgi:6-phosphofructokinase
MEVIVKMTKVNPWTGLIKWSNCFDYVGSYWTRSGSRYTGLTKEEATELETRATILGHLQRGGTPTVKDRVYASIMGAKAVELIAEGKKNRVVGYKNGEYIDFDINDALKMHKEIPEFHIQVANTL